MSINPNQKDVQNTAKQTAQNPNEQNLGNLEKAASKFEASSKESFKKVNKELNNNLSKLEKGQGRVSNALDKLAGNVDPKEVDKLIKQATIETMPAVPKKLPAQQPPQNNIPKPKPLDKTLADTQSFKDELNAITNNLKGSGLLAQVQKNEGKDTLTKEQTKPVEKTSNGNEQPSKVTGVVIASNQENTPPIGTKQAKDTSKTQQKGSGIISKVVNAVKSGVANAIQAVANFAKLGAKVVNADSLTSGQNNSTQKKTVASVVTDIKTISENHHKTQADINTRRKESVEKFKNNQSKTRQGNSSKSYKPSVTPPATSNKNNGISGR
jgi:hypothetical protein